MDFVIKAFDQARLLGHSWVGPEHFLLAVLAQPSAAAEAFDELHISHDRLAEHLRSLRHEPPLTPPDPDTSPTLSPAAYQIMGWAQGYAAASGLSEPESAHWLLATIYLEQGVAPDLHSLGASADAVIDALARRGVRRPSVKPPSYRAWRGHRRVEVGEAELVSVIELLGERHPPGSEWRWGFNWIADEPRRARVDTEDGIDLDAIVAEARRRLLR